MQRDRNEIIMISSCDKKILQNLASRFYEIGTSDLMNSRRQRWTNLNDLRSNEPLLLIYPEGAWRELDNFITLECQETIYREIELKMRRQLYQFDNFGDDMVINPYFETPQFISDSGWGVEIIKNHSEMPTGSWKSEPPIKNLHNDFEKLKKREIFFDEVKTNLYFNLACDALGDLMPVYKRSDFFWSAGLTRDIIDLVGLQELMMLMLDDPDGLHKLIKFMQEDYFHYMDQLENLGLVNANSACWHIGSGGLGFNSDLPEFSGSGKLKYTDCWGLIESQETVGVSPEMFGEFIWPYQKELAKRFGFLYYGCCEPVESRFKYIKEAQNLRGISCSPWSNMEKSAEQYGRNYAIYRKVNPGNIAVQFCENALRQDIRKSLDALGHLNLAIILKDTHTISNQPERYQRLTTIAKEEMAK